MGGGRGERAHGGQDDPAARDRQQRLADIIDGERPTRDGPAVGRSRRYVRLRGLPGEDVDPAHLVVGEVLDRDACTLGERVIARDRENPGIAGDDRAHRKVRLLERQAP